VTRLSQWCETWVLTSDLNRGAVERALAALPHDNLHICYAGLPERLKFLLRFAGGAQVYAYLWQWRAYFSARKLHRRVRFDAFHHLTYTNDWMASPAGALLPIRYLRGPGGGAHRTPKAFVRRYPLKGRMWERFRSFGQWALRLDPAFLLGQSRAKAILVCNHEALNAIPKRWRHKARLFPVNGVAPEALAEPARRQGTGFKVLTAGRLVRLKAFDLAIRAFAQFAARIEGCPAEMEPSLSIVGEGPERGRLEDLARTLGVGGKVKFEGWKSRADLWAEMRRSDVFLFPSLRDGGGLVVVEAMAAGDPVVCVDLGGPGMHVTPECGVKVKAESPEQVVSDLASALELIHRNPRLRQEMARAARKRAEEQYLWDVLAERMLGIYQDVLGGSVVDAPDTELPQEPHAERVHGFSA
jgi:glycosyltransferase involved in cell wall biosynthesis